MISVSFHFDSSKGVDLFITSNKGTFLHLYFNPNLVRNFHKNLPNFRLKMRLVILDDDIKVGEWAAKYVVKRINEFKPSKDKYFVLGKMFFFLIFAYMKFSSLIFRF